MWLILLLLLTLGLGVGYYYYRVYLPRVENSRNVLSEWDTYFKGSDGMVYIDICKERNSNGKYVTRTFDRPKEEVERSIPEIRQWFHNHRVEVPIPFEEEDQK